MPRKAPEPASPTRGPKLINKHDYRRFRVDLPTGETYKKNGETVERTRIVWLVGARDVGEDIVDGEKVTMTNEVILTKAEAEYVRNNPAYAHYIEEGLLSLTA